MMRRFLTGHFPIACGISSVSMKFVVIGVNRCLDTCNVTAEPTYEWTVSAMETVC